MIPIAIGTEFGEKAPMHPLGHQPIAALIDHRAPYAGAWATALAHALPLFHSPAPPLSDSPILRFPVSPIPRFPPSAAPAVSRSAFQTYLRRLIIKNMTPHRIITAILAIAVIILFYLQLKKPSAEAEAPQISGPAVPIASNIVYVNSDSLLENYVFYTTKKSEFESR